MSARPATTWSTAHDHLVIWASILVVSGLALAPLVISPTRLEPVAEILVLVALAQWWCLLGGRGGVPWLATHGFVGVGAYTGLVLGRELELPFVVTLLGAGVVGAAVAAAIGPVVSRLRGGSFVVATLVVAETFRSALVANHQLDRGAPVAVAGPGPEASFWAVTALVVISVAAVLLLGRSSLGLGLHALRADPAAASALGVSWRRTIVAASAAASAGTAALGAAVYVGAGEVSGEAFSIDRWLAPTIVLALLGGRRTVEGPVVGGLLYAALLVVVPGEDAWVIVIGGLAGLALSAFGIDGMWGLAKRWLGGELVAGNRRIVVPAPTPPSKRDSAAPLDARR